MSDSKRLFYIPIIAKALESDNPKMALRAAFDEIKNRGKLPEFKEGFVQFLGFIKFTTMTFTENFEGDVQPIIHGIYRLIYDLATGDFEGSDEQKEALISALRSHPKWLDEFERIQKMTQEIKIPDLEIGVEVLKEDQVIGTFPISPKLAVFSHISPGSYTIQLSNGRVVWKGELTREDLLWNYAYPGKELSLAAETVPAEQIPTKIELFLDGELEMSVFAGLESGEMRIRVRKA